jgi:uncharacterized protein
MKNILIGRKEEKAILEKAIHSHEAEMVAVIGRRRVGKTFLIKSVYGDRIKFDMTGIQKGSITEQLRHFTNRLNFHVSPPIPFQTPTNWLDAFHLLSLHFEHQPYEEKIVLFFDELPWIATRKSGFLKAFGVFWNTWASQKNVIVVICGSAASWMIQKVVRDTGGLHNRITRRVQLAPFSLAETEIYLHSRNIHLDRYQLIQLYMAMGGIPHYLKEIESGQSAAQNIDRIFFSQNGLLREEFDALYPSLFEDASTHIMVTRTLAEKWSGMTREEIIKSSKLSNGGTFTKVLEELLHSGFVSSYYAFGKKKQHISYRLTDEYSIFYLKFMDNQKLAEKGIWEKFSQTQSYKIWTGFAFENLCLKHISPIKKALGISGVYAETSTYRSIATEEFPAIQIDLVIDRNDHVINLLEMKFYNDEFAVSPAYAKDLRAKKTIFKAMTKTKKQLFLTLISTFGLLANSNSIGLIDQDLTMDVLFEG